jgi:hypothetical protein
MEEKKAALAKLGNEKSGAAEQIPAEYYKALAEDPETEQYLSGVIDDYWKSGSWPGVRTAPSKRTSKVSEKLREMGTPTNAARILLAKKEGWRVSFSPVNPRRPTTKVFVRFAHYRDSTTISEARQKGATPADLREDLSNGNLTLHDPTTNTAATVKPGTNDDSDALRYTQWLVASLKLLPKKGDLSQCKNWRGICLLDIASKFCRASASLACL